MRDQQIIKSVLHDGRTALSVSVEHGLTKSGVMAVIRRHGLRGENRARL